MSTVRDDAEYRRSRVRRGPLASSARQLAQLAYFGGTWRESADRAAAGPAQRLLAGTAKWPY